MGDFVVILIVCSVFFISLFNDSLKEYYEETYHKTLYLNNIYFKKMTEFKNYLENQVFYIKNNNLDETKPLRVEISQEKTNTQINFTRCSVLNYSYYINRKNEVDDLKPKIKILNKNDGLIVLGDSLMQGVGTAICNYARKEKIKCANIAKQSTGLLRKKYYNYANILDNTLKQTGIKNIVMLVGVNDLWDASENKKILKFGNAEWRNFYKNRINELVAIAKKYNANMFWYELPVVKNKEQNDKVKILNEIFFELANSNEYHFIKLNSILTKHFDYYIKINGKSKKIRSNDGIHFTTLGYSLVSQDFFNLVRFK